MSAEAAFERVVARMRDQADVEEGRALHAPGLKVDGRIFAMLVNGQLVVKLPAARCSELVERGEARPFTSGRRKMREWVSVGHSDADNWISLAEEALAFVRG